MENSLTGKTRTSRFADVIIVVFFAVLLVASVLLSIGSMLMTSFVDVNEHISFVGDNVVLNIVIVIAFVILLKYLKGFFRKINPKTAIIVLIAYTSVLGVLWVTSCQASPRADQLDILRNLQKILNNDFTVFSKPDSYFQLYPFQLGILFIFEMLLRLFGPGNILALAILNVVWLDMAYLAIFFLVKRIFNNRKIELLTILLLFACLQPILFCTFIYGNLMGLCFSLWAFYFVIKFIQTGKKSAVVISAALITVAMLAKFNSTIALSAMCLILLLHFLKKRGWFCLVAIALIIGMALGVSGLVQKSYVWRSNIAIGSGIPQTAWLEMGMQQNSSRYDGWFNGYPYSVYYLNGLKADATEVQVQKDIQSSMSFFLAHPKYAVSFFSGKVMSQWDEPTFESIWISQVAKEASPPHPDWVNNLYYGDLNGILIQYFDYYVEIIFVGFAAAMFFAIRKKAGLCFTIVPLAILGGFVYHMLFEAHSQYILEYFIMMIPFAAYGYYQLVNIKFGRRERKKEAV